MAEVYWIRLPEHTDMFSEGYIGITKNTAKSRFRGHVAASKKEESEHFKISRAINKYGKNNLIIETLVICDIEYASEIENKLRPTTNIGWNIAAGGQETFSYSGYTLSEETKDKMSKTRTGRKLTPEWRENISKGKKGISSGPLTKESIEKREKTRFYNNMDKYPEPWNNADIWYEHFSLGLNAYFTEKLLGLKKGLLTRIFINFKDGWVPLKDETWLSKFKKELSNGA